jgi:monoamine oxidase
VPTSILAGGAIKLPSVADPWLHAASQLPLGHVEKLFFELPDPEAFPEGAHLLGNPRSADTGSYMLRPIDMPVIEAFFGGDWLTGLHADDIAAKAREELGNLLGSDFARDLRPIAYSDWQRHPFVCGSYSYARPTGHAARTALARAVNERLAFAGEACAENDYATVHGAWASGRAAVEQLFGEQK